VRVETVFKDRFDDHSQRRLHHAAGDSGSRPKGDSLPDSIRTMQAIPSGRFSALPGLALPRAERVSFLGEAIPQIVPQGG
jgi:hypothetical protein